VENLVIMLRTNAAVAGGRPGGGGMGDGCASVACVDGSRTCLTARHHVGAHASSDDAGVRAASAATSPRMRSPPRPGALRIAPFCLTPRTACWALRRGRAHSLRRAPRTAVASYGVKCAWCAAAPGA